MPQETHRTAVFDDLEKARRAVDDAKAIGIRENEISLMVSSDEDDRSLEPHVRAGHVQHPSSDSARSLVGGGVGAAIGALVGSLALYATRDLGTASIVIGAALGIPAGALSGALVAKNLPRWARRDADVRRFDPIGPTTREDDRRSAFGAAIGATIASIGGTLVSHAVGIPNLWYFVTTGLAAGAFSFVFGALVGAMAGRGLTKPGKGRSEADTDAAHRVVVSVDCDDPAKLSRVETMLRQDGALLVRAH